MDEQLLQMFNEQISSKNAESEDSGNDEEDESKKDMTLEECARAGFRFAVKSPMGRRWNRYLESQIEFKKQYEERAKWANARFTHYQQWRSHVKKTISTDAKVGTLMNLDAIIAAEGGHHSQAVVQGSMNIAMSCIRKGHPWVEYNEDTVLHGSDIIDIYIYIYVYIYT